MFQRKTKLYTIDRITRLPFTPLELISKINFPI